MADCLHHYCFNIKSLMAAVSGSEKASGPWYVSKHLSKEVPPSRKYFVLKTLHSCYQPSPAYHSSGGRNSCWRPLPCSPVWSCGLTWSSSRVSSRTTRCHLVPPSPTEDHHVFVGEGEAVRVDDRMEEPVQVVNHPLVPQHHVQSPQRRGRADPFPGVDSCQIFPISSRNLND